MMYFYFSEGEKVWLPTDCKEITNYICEAPIGANITLPIQKCE